MLFKYLNKLTARFGYQFTSVKLPLKPDMAADPLFVSLYNQVRPFTMTSPERLYSLYQSIQYVVANKIPGDFVECGVWKGGSCMMMALLLKRLGITDKKIYLYDTFEGMSEPTEADKKFTGESANDLLNQSGKENDNSIWCYSTLEDVQSNVFSTGFDPQNFIFTKGKVEDSIPGVMPGEIALLRLDTDWYESTYHELIHLYPLLLENGILIIDDFGHWEGAKKAVLQYFKEKNLHPIIHRVDYTGRMIVKSGNMMV
ncbi:MAG: TylF/MycF/NovP-related O-methyltransferase [Chitinophagaceae bacterium]